MTGFAVAAVRAAIIETIASDAQMADVAVNLDAPIGHYAIETDSGLQMGQAQYPAAVWLAGQVNGTLAVLSLNPHGYEETWEVGIIAQVLPDTSADDLGLAEQRCAALIARILELLIKDHTLGVTEDVAPVNATPATFEWSTGALGPGSAARCVLNVNVHIARC